MYRTCGERRQLQTDVADVVFQSGNNHFSIYSHVYTVQFLCLHLTISIHL